MLRIAVAVAFTGAIVLASDDANARARFRMSSPSPKPAAAASMAKPPARQPVKPGPAATEPKPFAAAKPVNPQPVGGGTFVVIRGPRPTTAGSEGAPTQRAVGNDASGPLEFDPSLAAADDKATAEPATACLTTPQAVAAKEPPVAKDQVAKNDRPRNDLPKSEQPKAEAAPARVNAALVPDKPRRQATPVIAAVCYVQRDGTCEPSY